MPVVRMKGEMRQVLLYSTPKDLEFGDIVVAEDYDKNIIILECVGQSFDLDGQSLQVVLDRFNGQQALVRRITGVMRMEIWEEEMNQ